jgi:hypothetical protein
MKKLLFVLCLVISANQIMAQVYSDKVVGKKNANLKDSLQKKEYPYILPIWGKKATARGFDLPYSAGLNINYLWQESDIVIDNLQVGFNNGPMASLDEIIRFDVAKSTGYGINIRPDVWILPFLNIYGIFAKSKLSTDVGFGIYVPDAEGTWEEVLNTSTQANFDGMTMGFGMTPTIGVGGGFMALDMNFAWTDIAALEKPAFSFVFGPRFGKSFRLKKEQTVAVWVGGFRLKINSGTNGSLPIGDLFDTEGLQAKIDAGITKVGEKQQEVNAWWSGLSGPEQANPVNKAKYETANRALEKAGGFLNSASEAVGNIENSSVQYSLDKQQKDMWNFVVGGQYQFNKHLIFRAEYGFLTSRKQILAGIQYRFGL